MNVKDPDDTKLGGTKPPAKPFSNNAFTIPAMSKGKGILRQLLDERAMLLNLETAALQSGDRDLLLSWSKRISCVDERISNGSSTNASLQIRNSSNTISVPDEKSFDPEAAFPTAQYVAAFRAYDAMSSYPVIGKNIEAGPDLAAEILAGELGFAFADAMTLGVPLFHQAYVWSLVNRTMYFDELLVKYMGLGCKQVVLLAAGLDSRAWRMNFDPSVTVFEVDVPRCMKYKSEKIKQLEMYSLSCNRVVVKADLADPGWTKKLIKSGFNPNLPSVITAEGLLYYLPLDVTPKFFENVSSLMSTDSFFVGDIYLNLIDLTPTPHKKIYAKYGVVMESDYGSEEEVNGLLSDVSLEMQSFINVTELDYSKYAPKREEKPHEIYAGTISDEMQKYWDGMMEDTPDTGFFVFQTKKLVQLTRIKQATA